MPPPYLFLSDDWVAEARRIREEHAGGGIAVPTVVKLNQVITDVPFSDQPMKAHLDTSSGELVMELGHVAEPDVTITLEYETAKAIFVDGTAQAGMQAFMAGKIKVAGDLAKLIAALQQVNPNAFEASEVQRRIKAITVIEADATGDDEADDEAYADETGDAEGDDDETGDGETGDAEGDDDETGDGETGDADADEPQPGDGEADAGSGSSDADGGGDGEANAGPGAAEAPEGEAPSGELPAGVDQVDAEVRPGDYAAGAEPGASTGQAET